MALFPLLDLANENIVVFKFTVWACHFSENDEKRGKFAASCEKEVFAALKADQSAF